MEEPQELQTQSDSLAPAFQEPESWLQQPEGLLELPDLDSELLLLKALLPQDWRGSAFQELEL